VGAKLGVASADGDATGLGDGAAAEPDAHEVANRTAKTRHLTTLSR
jgi:hypothetical protein